MARSKGVEYERDEFDNPPAGPVGLHRGKPSAWPRVAAFLVVLLVAVLIGAGVYAYSAGILGNKNASPALQSSASSSQTADAGKDSSADSSSAADSASDSSKDSSSADSSSSSSSQSTSGSSTQSPSDSQQTDSQQQVDQAAAQPDPSVQVLVLNATNTTGLARQQAGVLQGQGYSAVTTGNASAYSYTYPSQNTVWYSDESQLATAKDVASKLGIAQVAQAQGLAQPIVVVYVG